VAFNTTKKQSKSLLTHKVDKRTIAVGISTWFGGESKCWSMISSVWRLELGYFFKPLPASIDSNDFSNAWKNLR
jgi:hypothetical protein